MGDLNQDFDGDFFCDFEDVFCQTPTSLPNGNNSVHNVIEGFGNSGKASTSKDESKDRFTICSENEIQEKLVSHTPENTRKKVAWAIKLFRDWHNNN